MVLLDVNKIPVINSFLNITTHEKEIKISLIGFVRVEHIKLIKIGRIVNVKIIVKSIAKNHLLDKEAVTAAKSIFHFIEAKN